MSFLLFKETFCVLVKHQVPLTEAAVLADPHGMYAQLWHRDNCKALFGVSSYHWEGDDQQCSWLLKCDRIFWSLLCNLCSCCGSLFCRVLFTVYLQTQIWVWFLYTYLISNKTTALLLIRLQHKQWCKGRSNPSEIYGGCYEPQK